MTNYHPKLPCSDSWSRREDVTRASLEEARRFFENADASLRRDDELAEAPYLPAEAGPIEEEV